MSKLRSWIFWLMSDFRGGIYRGSNHLSLWLRKRIEKLNFRQTLGVNLAGLTFFAAIVVPQVNELTSSLEVNLNGSVTTIEVTPTDTFFQWPLSRFGITTLFSITHPGIDLTAPLGTPVYPVANGVVSWTNSIPWGYGNHLLVEHDRGAKSLYAHLSKIEVAAGQEVSKKTEIGQVGATGWATGNHLHLEVYQDDSPVNPLEVLPALPK